MEAFGALLQKYQPYGWLAFVVAVFATPVAIRLAFRFRVLDLPDQKLKPHARPTPYLGGTAICVAWAVAMVTSLLTDVTEPRIALPVLLGGIALSVMGLVDDIRHLSPKMRLLIGAAVILTVLLSTQTGFRLVESVLRPMGIELPAVVATPLSVLVGIVIVLGACNSTNLIDGLDGLCSGVTALISLGFFLLASHLAVHRYSEEGDAARLTIAIALFGAAMGFLPWNFNPAKIFMGDAGSVLLGYTCGMMILLFAERGIFRWVIGALMIFALPIFDTALAMFRRWRAGRSIFEGDRSHFYDQLVQRGLSVRKTVVICYALTIFYEVIGLLVIWVTTTTAALIFAAVCAGTAAVAWGTGLTHPDERMRRNPLQTALDPPS